MTPAASPDRSVLIVDGANVVGSRPDGWWRDRPGAARRLHGVLVAAGPAVWRAEDGPGEAAAGAVTDAAEAPPPDVAYDEVVLVLEGLARSGVPAGSEGGLRTVHASGSGDDTIVAEAQAAVDSDARVVVVTADRGLVVRVTEVGAAVRGPAWLLSRL